MVEVAAAAGGGAGLPKRRLWWRRQQKEEEVLLLSRARLPPTRWREGTEPRHPFRSCRHLLEARPLPFLVVLVAAVVLVVVVVLVAAVLVSAKLVPGRGKCSRRHRLRGPGQRWREAGGPPWPLPPRLLPPPPAPPPPPSLGRAPPLTNPPRETEQQQQPPQQQAEAKADAGVEATRTKIAMMTTMGKGRGNAG